LPFKPHVSGQAALAMTAGLYFRMAIEPSVLQRQQRPKIFVPPIEEDNASAARLLLSLEQ
jgi:hypothetical protein